MIDLNGTIDYEGFNLNDPNISTTIVPGGGDLSGVSGCVTATANFSDTDVVQFLEKRSQSDGQDAGPPFLGGRRLHMTGTLYATSAAGLFDAIANMRAALSPTLAYRAELADKGYRPLTFSVPTLRTDSDSYPDGTIALRVLAMPWQFSYVIERRKQGGNANLSLAVPWEVIFRMKDPTITGDTAHDIPLNASADSAEAVTINAGTDIVTLTGPGPCNLAAGDKIVFTSLTGGTGLSINTIYYVIADSLTDTTFKVSTTSGGANVNITVNYTAGTYVIVTNANIYQSADIVNRGNYHTPVNALFAVGKTAGTIRVQIGDSDFTLTIPASSNDRIIRFKGSDKIVTSEENSVETLAMGIITFNNSTTWPLIASGQSPYTVTPDGIIFTGVDGDSHLWYFEAYA